ncbi:MAG: hypothetical protein WB392_06980, partial [Methanotrichaceae archaeon]
IRILNYLLANLEDLSASLPPMEEFSAEKMRQQICADSRETIQYFTASDEINKKEPIEVQNDLITLGLL